MDVEFYKGTRFQQSNKLDVRLYQKSQNKFLYLPPQSFHNKAVFPAFISSELSRYRLRCTSDADYKDVAAAFHQRLLDRGYTNEFLNPLFSQQPDRQQLLIRASGTNQKKEPPLVFSIPLTPRTRQHKLAECLRFTDDLFADPASALVFGNRRPIICFSREKKLAAPRPHDIHILSTSPTHTSYRVLCKTIDFN
jgi:hypothetical protein